MMLATLFDFPWEERRKLTYWSDVAICNVAAPDAPVHSEQERFAELLRMADASRTLAGEGEAPPRLDLISMMAHSQGTSDMPEMEFVGNLALLIVGGNDTTRNSMSGGLLALSENPAELAKLRADPGARGEPRRRDDPLPDPGHPHAPHRHARRRACRPAHPAGRQGRHVVRIGQPRRERDREPGAFIDRSQEAAPASVLSAPASTAASATGWRTCNCAYSGRRSSRAISRSRSWGRRSGSTPTSSAASASCLCAWQMRGPLPRCTLRRISRQDLAGR